MTKSRRTRVRACLVCRKGVQAQFERAHILKDHPNTREAELVRGGLKDGDDLRWLLENAETSRQSEAPGLS